jgi:ubiquinone/menaquinone biosynthesis C-methylase UbiE
MENNKGDVYKSYEKIADWFDSHRSRELCEKPWLDKAIALLPKKPKILDLGCGMGDPIIPYFLEKGCLVTGVDGSAKLISLAKERYPEVEFITRDMRDLEFNRKFDLIIAWHSFFHLSQNDQRGMFKTFTSNLKNGGILMFTSGKERGEIWSNNGGENLYHASLSLDEYKETLKQYEFTLIDHKIADPECENATIWLAKLDQKHQE